MIHDLQSEVSGDYGKALLILAEVPCTKSGVRCYGNAFPTNKNQTYSIKLDAAA